VCRYGFAPVTNEHGLVNGGLEGTQPDLIAEPRKLSVSCSRYHLLAIAIPDNSPIAVGECRFHRMIAFIGHVVFRDRSIDRLGGPTKTMRHSSPWRSFDSAPASSAEYMELSRRPGRRIIVMAIGLFNSAARRFPVVAIVVAYGGMGHHHHHQLSVLGVPSGGSLHLAPPMDQPPVGHVSTCRSSRVARSVVMVVGEKINAKLPWALAAVLARRFQRRRLLANHVCNSWHRERRLPICACTG